MDWCSTACAVLPGKRPQSHRAAKIVYTARAVQPIARSSDEGHTPMTEMVSSHPMLTLMLTVGLALFGGIATAAGIVAYLDRGSSPPHPGGPTARQVAKGGHEG
jgi:hypothetical protein